MTTTANNTVLSNSKPAMNEMELLFQVLIDHLGELARTQRQMAGHLQTLVAQSPSKGATYRATLAEYSDYDWEQIDASVLESDEWGATVVEWNGKIWKRRTMDNKYGANIWFARCVGKEDEENKYAWLINFVDKEPSMDVEPLGQNARAALQKLGVKPRSQRNQPTTAPQSRPQGAAPSIPPPLPPPTPPTPPPPPVQAETKQPPPKPAAPDAVMKKAKALIAMGAVFHDAPNQCYGVGVLPNIHTVKKVRGKIVCDCDDFASACEGDSEGATCADIEAVKLYVAAQNEAKAA